jgi:hypothetical protein
LLLARRPVLFQLAGGGPSGAASAAFVPSFRGADSGAVAIGDPLAGAAGRVHLFFIDGTLDSVPDMTLDGQFPGDLFGASVAGVGDVDGDGFGDLVVGAPGRGAGAGSAYLFRGATTPGLVHAVRYDGAGAGDAFGAAIAGGGDLNFDTRPDFAIGAPGASGGIGHVGIVHGATSVPSAMAQTLVPTTPASYASRPSFGSALALGDLTGDGIADLAVGAPGFSSGRGQTCVYGGAPGSLSLVSTIEGSTPFDRLGTSLLTGDFSGEGSPDLAIGAPGRSAGRGEVSVLLGGPALDAIADFTDTGENPDDAFGSALAIGDLYPQVSIQQVLIGAPLADFDGLSSGALYMLALPPAVDVQAGLVELEAGGGPLAHAQYLDPSGRVRARLTSRAPIALERSGAQIDELPCAIVATDDVGAVEIVLPADIGDGLHRLRVTLATAGVEATIERDVTTFRRFELLGARLGPSPTRGSAEAVFTMTRPGTYRVDVFDAAGRRVARVGPSGGAAGENRVGMPELAERGSGIYFYRIEASFGGRTVTSRGRVALVH